MSAITQVAAQRLAAARAGVTGAVAADTNPGAVGGKGSGAVPTASPAEIAYQLPTEFGDLTGLFGGEAQPAQQFEPMQVARTIPSGSVAGPLGGRIPDWRNVVNKAAATVKPAGSEPPGTNAPAEGPATPVALSAAAKNTIAKVRGYLKI